MGAFLVALERLEQAQRPGVFLAEKVEATPTGVALRQPSGVTVTLPYSSTTGSIAEALRIGTPNLQIPRDDAEFPLSSEPNVQVQWAQLHYALGAFESLLLADAHVRVVSAERHGTSATVQVIREPDRRLETYTLDLDREIDIGSRTPSPSLLPTAASTARSTSPDASLT